MSRRLAAVTVAAVALAAGAVPAVAAKPKPKPKPITGTYKVQLLPDYSLNQMEQCASVIPQAQDKRDIQLPAKGTLKVVLDGGDLPGPGAGQGDWDLYTLDAQGQLSASESASVHEETIDKIKGKTTVSIWVCNLLGTPDGTVTWTFTYA